MRTSVDTLRSGRGIRAEPSAVFPGDNGDHPIANHDELLTRYPGAMGGKTGFADAARKTFVGAAARGGRRLVVAMMYGLVREGGPTYLGPGRRPARLGLCPQPSVRDRHALGLRRHPLRFRPVFQCRGTQLRRSPI